MLVVKKCVFILFFVISVGVTSPAEAILIVDTGTPTPGSTAYSLFYESSTSFQNLAGQFTTTQNYNINSLEGFISLNQGQGLGGVDAVIYYDLFGQIDLVGEILRQSFTIPEMPPGAPLSFDWRGAFGLDYFLEAGTYWLAFEVHNTSVARASMLSGVPNPLHRYAFDSGSGWTKFSLNVGMRINAEEPGSQAVPEPATMMLFGSGLLGAALRRRFQG